MLLPFFSPLSLALHLYVRFLQIETGPSVMRTCVCDITAAQTKVLCETLRPSTVRQYSCNGAVTVTSGVTLRRRADSATLLPFFDSLSLSAAPHLYVCFFQLDRLPSTHEISQRQSSTDNNSQ